MNDLKLESIVQLKPPTLVFIVDNTLATTLGINGFFPSFTKHLDGIFNSISAILLSA